MRPILLALLVTFTGLSTTHARASDIPQTTGEMYNACKPIAGSQSFNLQGKALFQAGYCLGMIEAVTKRLGMDCIFDKDKPWVPKADVFYVRGPALTQAFVNYARDNPQEWENPPLGVLTRAFRQYFPCK